MKSTHVASMLLIALGGLFVPAQEGAAGLDDRIVVSDDHNSSTSLYYMGKNRIRSGEEKELDKDFYFLKYSYGDRDYRKLSESEAKEFDAMHRVDAKRLGLYLDGKRVRTNVLWVTKVLSAYHWNGGVLVMVRTSRSRWHYSGENDIGFIDPKTNMCKFTKFFWPYPAWETKTPGFLVPVIIDTENKDLALEVEFPEKCYRNEKFDVTVSLTNASDRPIMVPDSLTEGLGLSRDKPGELDDRTPPLYRALSICSLKLPEYPDAREVKSSLLMPSEKREAVIPFDVWKALHSPGSHRVAFYWDGFLAPGGRGRLSRYICEKWVEVVEQTIDTSSKDLSLEVVIPESVGSRERLNVAFSLTNKSNKTIMVPNSLGDGLGAVWIVEYVRGGKYLYATTSEKRERKARKLMEAGNKVEYHYHVAKCSLRQVPHGAPRSPLGPGERREGKASLDASYRLPGRYRVGFHWDCLLDPDDRGKVSRFSVSEKWIGVTK